MYLITFNCVFNLNDDGDGGFSWVGNMPFQKENRTRDVLHITHKVTVPVQLN